MATLKALNNSCELNVTPSRKRKRIIEKSEEQQYANKTAAATTSCFTNAAFSSTPKKYLARRRTLLKKNQQNRAIFPDVGLEVKSIAEIAKDHKETNTIAQNPYEVLRKPPKKKKRHAEETSCFENPALNLELPEKVFNPYEVVREITCNKTSNCFSNPALNLKVQDASVLCNPFEVQRKEPNRDLKILKPKCEVHPDLINPFKISPEIDMQQGVLTPEPCKFKLGLPFVPRVGCRIDFKDISMSQLTPSKLFAEKLIFSPESKAKISLGSVGEETTMDIGKELDRYQLELENSINEAKLRKSCVPKKDLLSSPITNHQIQIVDFEKKPKFTQKLCGISEDVENEQTIQENAKQMDCHVQKEKSPDEVNNIIADTNPFRFDLNKQYQRTETAEVVEIENLDELYNCYADEQEDEDSFDFKAPAPFVRAYTKPIASNTKLTVSKESLESKKSDNSDGLDGHIKKSLNVKNIIRKSIRKLMYTHNHGQQQETEADNNIADDPEYEKSNGFMNAIRQSLRRKPARNLDEKPVTKKSEISIIDETERTMKLKSDVLQTEYVKIEDLTNEKKNNLRNSIRKSTREVRNQFLKSVFHKNHEEYDFKK